MNVLPMATFEAPQVHWLSLTPILIVLGGFLMVVGAALGPALGPRDVARELDDVAGDAQ